MRGVIERASGRMGIVNVWEKRREGEWQEVFAA